MDVTFFEQEPFYTKTDIPRENFPEEYMLRDIIPATVTTVATTTPQFEAVFSLDQHTLSPSQTSTPTTVVSTPTAPTPQVEVANSPNQHTLSPSPSIPPTQNPELLFFRRKSIHKGVENPTHHEQG